MRKVTMIKKSTNKKTVLYRFSVTVDLYIRVPAGSADKDVTEAAEMVAREWAEDHSVSIQSIDHPTVEGS